MKMIDLSGKRYGRLSVVELVGRSESGETMWRCICDCGNETTVSSAHIRSGRSKSCGCYRKEVAMTNLKAVKNHRYKHHMAGTRLYRIYSHMKSRCTNPNDHKYSIYGARGIKICDDWINSFESFAEWAKENGYSDNLTIDRIDVNGNYTPDNCRWADAKQQANNRRSNHYVNDDGEMMTLTQFADKYGVERNTMYFRYKKRQSVEDMKKLPLPKCKVEDEQ